MKIVGITGGIGCGKTTVLNIFQDKFHVPCFVMDTEAKKLYDEIEVRQEIMKVFGRDVFHYVDGICTFKVDTKKLGSVVFNDKDKLKQLNTIIHPRVRKMFYDWVASQIQNYPPYILVESAIMFETGFYKDLDAIITVYIEEEERIRRIQKRDNISIEEIKRRMNKQLSSKVKLELADYIVLNYEGNPRQKQIEIIDRSIRQSSFQLPVYKTKQDVINTWMHSMVV